MNTVYRREFISVSSEAYDFFKGIVVYQAWVDWVMAEVSELLLSSSGNVNN